MYRVDQIKWGQLFLLVTTECTRGFAPRLGRSKMVALRALYGILESAAAAARSFKLHDAIQQ